MSKIVKRVADSWPGRFVTQVLRRYFVHDVSRQGAALAYYLMFMIFPFLIFLSSLLGRLDLDVSGIVRTLSPLLPAGVLELLEAYLDYVTETSSTAMMWFGLGFSVYFPMRATNCLMRSVRRAYHLPQPKNQIKYMAKVLLYTVFLMFTIVLALVLMSFGQRALHYFGGIFTVPDWFVEIWDTLRYAVLAVVVFACVGLLYTMAQDSRQPVRNIVPGALFSFLAWMALSAAYSFYAGNVANYTVIYGTLGTVVVLLTWLYLTAIVLIMGAELNDALIAMRAESARRKKNTGGERISGGEEKNL